MEKVVGEVQILGKWKLKEKSLDFIQLLLEGKEEKMFIQSSNQAFYYIDNFDNLELNDGDIIIAEREGEIVGSRSAANGYEDIPVMGNDLSLYSSKALSLKKIANGTCNISYVNLDESCPLIVAGDSP